MKTKESNYLKDIQNQLDEVKKEHIQTAESLATAKAEIRSQDLEIDRITEERTKYVQMLAEGSVRQQESLKLLSLQKLN